MKNVSTKRKTLSSASSESSSDLELHKRFKKNDQTMLIPSKNVVSNEETKAALAKSSDSDAILKSTPGFNGMLNSCSTNVGLAKRRVGLVNGRREERISQQTVRKSTSQAKNTYTQPNPILSHRIPQTLAN
jgi:hypothetical protein